MNKVSQFVRPIEGFQYSVNIYYDIYDDKKIKSYIPSVSSLHIIEDILSSTESKSTDRARILTGAYGKGKSHLILCLLALLSGRPKELFQTLLKKAHEIDPILEKNIIAYLEEGKKLLPVIVNANSLDIKATLLQSLQFALEQAKIANLMPTTFYDVAIQKIKDWQEGFPETYVSFQKKVGQSGTDFIRELKSFNQSAYQLFVKVYPQLTSGSEFNPIAGSDVIGVYDSVAEELKKLGYQGIFIVYDEFGKFLEGSVDKSSAMDIKILQDLAEKCNRSAEKQLHILLISHKDIDNYIGQLPKVKVDAWKAVSNRFKSISINNKDNEIYDMVGTVLYKEQTGFRDFIHDNQEQFLRLQKQIDDDRQAFGEVRKIMGEKFITSCYPLHPYSLVLLPKVSELVAQNERTIFTFLSSEERFSVPYFLRTTTARFPLIEPDYIYDYFEKLFKGEPYGSVIKKQWEAATTALSKIRDQGNELAEKIIKTIALIYCVNDFEIIPPSWTVIEDIYSINYSLAEIQSAKELLKNNHLLIELLYRPYVRISEGSGHDVLELIKQEKYKIESKINVIDVLEDIVESKYFYPVQYNDENEITRYFELKFIIARNLFSLSEDEIDIDSVADGVIYAIMLQSEEDREYVLERVAHINNKRTIFILPKESFISNNLVTEYQAIKNLIAQYAGKEVSLVDELNYLLEDRQELLVSFINNNYLHPELGQAEFYYLGQNILIRRKAQLSQLMSQIMETVYYRTPKIINELINKNVLTAPIKSARQKILIGILSRNYHQNLGLSGNGPELNVLIATLITPGIFTNTEKPLIRLTGIDNRFEAVLQEIKNFIIESSKNNCKTFAELYEILCSAHSGFGLKKGVVPIYLATVLATFNNNAVILKKGRELPVDANVLLEIERDPNSYQIVLEEWDNEKDLYIAGLESIFSAYVNQMDKPNGEFIYIVKAMRRWYLQLTRFEASTRFECTEDGKILNLDKSIIKFRNLLSNPELNAHELIFEKLPKCFDTSEYNKIISEVRKAYQVIGQNLYHYEKRLAEKIRLIFKGKGNESLASILANYYDGLKTRTKEHAFSGKTSMFIAVIKHPNRDELRIIEDIARAILNLRISDFTDEIMSLVEESIKEVKDQIDQYDQDERNDSNSGGGYKITFIDENGNEIVRQFDKVECSSRAKLLYNDITSQLEEFGQAVSSDEKRQVLFNILKELM